MECDLSVAREIQSKLLPQSIPDLEGVRIQCLYRPSVVLGGDFYDVVLPDPGVLAVLVADASGTGLSAAMISVMAKMAFAHGITHHKTPKGVLKEVNQHLLARCMEGQFLAAFLGFINLHSLSMRFCNAALCAPVLHGPDRFEVLDTEGSFLGVFENANLHEREVQLREGDRIILHTDGVTRLFGVNGHLRDTAHWHQLIRDRASLTLDAFLHEIDRDLEACTAQNEREDDITVVGIEFAYRRAHSERFVILSDPEELHSVEDAILRAMGRHGYGERDQFGMKLALEEAVTNAIMHGNRMNRSKKVTIDFTVDDKKVELAVADEGPGFDSAKVPDPTRGEALERPCGRGIVLMKAYMDDVRYVPPGNKVVLTKRAPWA
jgi:serine/threonine-protein kinase RsbW